MRKRSLEFLSVCTGPWGSSPSRSPPLVSAAAPRIPEPGGRALEEVLSRCTLRTGGDVEEGEEPPLLSPRSRWPEAGLR